MVVFFIHVIVAHMSTSILAVAPSAPPKLVVIIEEEIVVLILKARD